MLKTLNDLRKSLSLDPLPQDRPLTDKEKAEWEKTLAEQQKRIEEVWKIGSVDLTFRGKDAEMILEMCQKQGFPVEQKEK